MTQDWKPGDVALIRTGNGFDAVGLRSGIPSNMGWAYTSSDLSGSPIKYGNCWASDRDGAAVIRPLVVIDAESAEDIERLAMLLVREKATLSDRGVAHSGLAAALREFGSPTQPKPDEPLGLGAVVEDAEGRKWIAHEPDAGRVSTGYRWLQSGPVVGKVRQTWASVPAVRILSEGVR